MRCSQTQKWSINDILFKQAHRGIPPNMIDDMQHFELLYRSEVIRKSMVFQRCISEKAERETAHDDAEQQNSEWLLCIT